MSGFRKKPDVKSWVARGGPNTGVTDDGKHELAETASTH